MADCPLYLEEVNLTEVGQREGVNPGFKELWMRW